MAQISGVAPTIQLAQPYSAPKQGFVLHVLATRQTRSHTQASGVAR